MESLSWQSLEHWIVKNDKPRNFDGLLDGFKNALDTEELNNKFYRELLEWFHRAVKEAKFPTDQARIFTPEEHIIRLITRLLFAWFMKEKGLIADELFNEEQVKQLLKGYDPQEGDSYYRAILQNLFFATLNTKIDKRRFSRENNSTHRDFSCYRYHKEIQDPQALIALFEQTPFINGGLFDCLDSEKASVEGGWRRDYFTDNERQRRGYSIPNQLFFDEKGIISLFNRYRFTVEESTPVEQDVALDPELLGKVFESLLHYLQSETSKTARQQSGSYYTPRKLVDYMVDEALREYLMGRAEPENEGRSSWEKRLRRLLDYKDPFEDVDSLFSSEEKKRIVRTVAEIKVLDPAVGSGAFPMSVLHKLTLILSRIDADNREWGELQKKLATEKASAAFDRPKREERDARLDEISETFERYKSSNFGRKLYLIKNSIFGVDKDPVACQIAKLRFFISLAIEQEADRAKTKENFGIRPLPNLETRFVVADTLLSLDRSGPQSLAYNDESVKKLERQIIDNNEEHFHATARREKRECREKDKDLRQKLAKELEDLRLSPDAAEKIAKWNRYDQNSCADWFDAKHMFGVADDSGPSHPKHGGQSDKPGTAGAFDIVLGNPPYIKLSRLQKRYQDAGYDTFANGGDIYQLFYERGCRLLKPDQGLLAYITSNSWLKTKYGGQLRHYLVENHSPLKLLEMGAKAFKTAIVDVNVLLLKEGPPSHPIDSFPAVDIDERSEGEDFPPCESSWSEIRLDKENPEEIWSVLSSEEWHLKGKMEDRGVPLKKWDLIIKRGITTGCNEAFIIDNDTKERLIAEHMESAKIIKPMLRGRDLRPYRAKWANLWLIATFPSLKIDINDYPAIKDHLSSFGRERLEQSGKTLTGGTKSRRKSEYSWFETQDPVNYHEHFGKEKLLWKEIGVHGKFAYDDSEMHSNNSTFIITGKPLKYLCAVLNNPLITWFTKSTALTVGAGDPRWLKLHVEKIPVPQIPAEQQQDFIQRVDLILNAKDADPEADTSELEAEINQLVYELYGLTAEEIKIIEEKSKA